MASFNLHFSNGIFLFIILNLFLHSVHPFSFNISHFPPGAKDVLYEGDATTSSGAIDLNLVDYKFRVGRAIYGHPVRIWDSSTGFAADFTTHFSFSIDTLNSTLHSDGLAFFLAPVNFPIPPNSAGGFLGLFNTTMTTPSADNQIIMVEFDTFPNNEWDPNVEHIGINFNSINSSVYASWDPALYSGKIANVWITYNATLKNLSAFWTYEENPVFTGQVSLSYMSDITQILPEWVIIGFSASTGIYTERHTIYSWEFEANFEGKQHGEKHLSSTSLIAIIVVSCFSFLVVLAAVPYWIQRIRGKKFRRDQRKVVGLYINRDIERGALPRRFTYQELRNATNRFASDRRLGQGGSGHVYKGTLSHLGQVVAVKRIFSEIENSEKNFVNEVKVISGLVHRNLVKFIGWCHEQGELLLVYEYMPNGSLDMHLFGNRGKLEWKVRYRIALGLTSALHYLHEDAGPCVLHRDIKSANVLLDTDFSTKLGDFGVAKLIDPLLRTQKTGVVGTLGYLAPEYLNEGRASRESDMFSFGVVALEIACGRRTYDYGEFQVPLIRWVWQLYLSGSILTAADERLGTDFDAKEMECLLLVGLWCTHPSKRERPKAGEVIKVLKFESPAPELPHDMHEQDFI